MIAGALIVGLALLWSISSALHQIARALDASAAKDGQGWRVTMALEQIARMLESSRGIRM